MKEGVMPSTIIRPSSRRSFSGSITASSPKLEPFPSGFTSQASATRFPVMSACARSFSSVTGNLTPCQRVE